ncbi:hypothetical protein [Inhella gelatinilytica]|uniref:Uncharacterized protein n=1 Tax=Inhella gelatinilytica TaxID=2795030 RepID=A0A931IV58_9BURK|nr:hypothetical protein [Inhella gelatinilytica]MBH9551579.1 hypothetical protein [Inhella gelatinilytica]
MKPVFRALLALLAGMMVAVAVIATVETASHQIWPIANVGVNARDPAAMAALIQSLPLGALVSVVLAWCAGAASGAWMGYRFAVAPQQASVGLGVAGVIWLATAANLAAIPHPTWMTLAGLLGVPLSGWAVVQWERRRMGSATRSSKAVETPPSQ